MRWRVPATLAFCSLAAAGCASPQWRQYDGGSDQADGALADRVPLPVDRPVETPDNPPDAADDQSAVDLLADDADDGGNPPPDAGADGGDADGPDADARRPDAGPEVAPPSCSDGMQNSDETDVDCGGHCGQCGPGKKCLIGANCSFGFCRAGRCGECNVAADCPGAETECQHRYCSAGVCSVAQSLAGTVLANQIAGDCKVRVCAAGGVIATNNDGSDLPDDHNPCTNDFCMNSEVPSHTMLPLNSSCGGGNRCNATGQCVGCLDAATCPGADTVCQTRVCSAQGVCGFDFRAAGTQLTDPAGDCKRQQCDGAGNAQTINDDNDLPADDNPCTLDQCSSGTPVHRPVDPGVVCGSGLVCDGANRCVQCLSAATCPGPDTECRPKACSNGSCGFANTRGGTVTTAQITGDCKRAECDGAGNTFTVPEPGDLPVDGNLCTADLCNGDAPSNPNLNAGTSCGGTSVCDGAGVCVGCLIASTCPGSDTECHSRTCSAGHQCGLRNLDRGTALAVQMVGDCLVNQCDGNGNPEIAVDDSDRPIDGNPCTQDLCAAGSPSHLNEAPGTSCGSALICDGAGACVGCVTLADCPASTSPCQTAACTSGHCEVRNLGAGTLVPPQTSGDCKRNQCDGLGNAVIVADDGDPPVDGNACTQDLCLQGMPSNPPEPRDTACAQSGGSRCNGIAGAEACVQCNDAGQCPGSDDECQSRVCTAAGLCQVRFTPDGTVLSSQMLGDCQRKQCLQGSVASVTDVNDRPFDLNGCTQDLCTGSTPSNPPELPGTPCNETGGSVCNGARLCVQCNVPDDCPGGPDTECHARTCVAGTCGIRRQSEGFRTSVQDGGDCQVNVCDAAGNIVPITDAADVFVDGKACTSDVCTNGVAENPPLGAGAACSQNGGKLCDGAGTCVQCLSDGDCDASHDTACNKFRCRSAACVFVPEPADTPVADGAPGDCHRNTCDGTGGVSSIADDGDLPPANECANSTCVGGMLFLVNRPHGYSCTQSGGRTCDGAGSCLLTFSVVRLGDGGAALSSAATAVFVEERRVSDGSLIAGATVPLPIAEGSTDDTPRVHAFSLSGNATSDGSLSLSNDGRYLVLAGYNAAPGTPGVAGTTSATANRLVARLGAALDVDTSTLLGDVPFSANNARGATSNDGLEFWAGGAGGGTAGVWYIPYGQYPPAPVQLYNAAAVRWLHVIDGQLYGTSNNSPNTNIFTVGTGMPTTAGQSLTSLPGMATAGASPFGFVVCDRTPTIPGIDTVYVADDSSARGIQKWTASFDTSTPPAIVWGLSKTLVQVSSGTSPIGFRGLALVNETPTQVTLVATTGESNGAADRIVLFVDSGSAVPVGTVLLSAPTNTTFRGLALSPRL